MVAFQFFSGIWARGSGFYMDHMPMARALLHLCAFQQRTTRPYRMSLVRVISTSLLKFN